MKKQVKKVLAGVCIALAATCGGLLFTACEPTESSSNQQQDYQQSGYTAENGIEYKLASDRTYYYVSNGKEVIENEITLEEEIEGIPVKGIAYNAFKDCRQITSITLPSGIDNISSAAFSGCINLRDVKGGSGLIGIAANAFSGCIQLRKIDFSMAAGLKSIGESAFSACSNLKEVNLSQTSITTMGNSAFSDCIGLEKLTLPDGLTTIKQTAFSGCESLRTIALPKGVKTVNQDAFANCTSLTAVEFQGTLEQWCEIEFETIYANPLTYGHSLFIDGEQIKDLDVPSSLTEIKSATFSGGNFTSVALPAGLKKIGTYAFRGCGALSTIALPSSLTLIEADAFRNCYNLIEVENHSGIRIEKASSTNGFVGYYAKTISANPSGKIIGYGDFSFYVDGEEVTLVKYNGTAENLTLPDGLVGRAYDIANGAFFCNSRIKSVSIPAKVKNIGNYAFSNCTALESVTIAEGVESIGVCSFEYCKSLMNIVIPQSVKTIDKGAFRGCEKLETVSFSEGLQTLGDYAFYQCSMLRQAILPDSLQELGRYAFAICERLEKASTGNGVTAIGTAAFGACYVLNKITVGRNVTVIGTDSFLYCHRLFEIENNSSVQLEQGTTKNGSIAYYAKNIYGTGANGGQKLPYYKIDGFEFFYYENEYFLYNYAGTNKEIVLPETCNGNRYNVYDYAFMNNVGITKVTISSGVDKIGEDGFAYCKDLREIVCEEGLKEVGEHAFRNNINLEKITLPKSLVSIADDVFTRDFSLSEIYYNGTIGDWCKIKFASESANPFLMGGDLYIGGEKVTEITLPSDLKTIGAYAFCGALNVKKVTIPESVTTIEANAFSNSAVTEVNFLAPDGWKTMNGVPLPKENLQDGKRAAKSLRFTYKGYKWTRR